MALEWRGDQIANAIDAVGEAALFNAAEHIRDVSQNLVPIDTHDLQLSIIAQAEGREAIVSSDSVYAARQHEETGWHHEVGQAKYLKAALDAEGQRAMQMVANQIKGQLGL